MIKVLQNWQEVDDATQALQAQGLPRHITVQKNWDQFLLYQLLVDHDREARILDLGCGDCCTLDFLAALGFTHLHGIDLQIKESVSDRPYTLHEGDMTNTALANESYDLLVSISVIEHGVNLRAFFTEAARLLKPGGLLFITTDYWETKLSIDDAIKPFGLSWSIYSKDEIQEVVHTASKHQFTLKQDFQIPACDGETVSWYNQNYTFIALAFERKRS